jgi:hypothetical protein
VLLKLNEIIDSVHFIAHFIKVLKVLFFGIWSLLIDCLDSYSFYVGIFPFYLHVGHLNILLCLIPEVDNKLMN